MFKIWKSIFNIDSVKIGRIKRLKCFLYGRFIALLLSSSIVFTSSDIIHEEDSKDISELKSFYQVHEFFIFLKTEIFKGEIAISKLLKKIINAIRRLGIKSRKKAVTP